MNVVIESVVVDGCFEEHSAILEVIDTTSVTNAMVFILLRVK